MAIAHHPPRAAAERTATPTPALAPGRDGTIDAIRTACLLVVVVLHALMVGIENSHGSLVTSVAMDGQPWFAPLTWALQVMPLFFIAGGFASLSQWRQMQSRGEHWTTYVVARTRRLVIPAVAMIAISATGIAIARAAGLSDELAAEAGHRIAQPLWFLAVYIGASALVPAMARLHRLAPKRTVAALSAAIVAVDLTRIVTGIDGIGYANLLFVWLFAQQLGFFARSWRSDLHRASRRTPAVTLVAALTAIVTLMATGLWSTDLIANLNPPTILLALLAVVHLCALRLAKPTLDRAFAHPAASRLVRIANPRAMTVYLWHMPLIMALIGVLWAAEIPMPEPHSAAWWATRVPWLVSIALVLIPATAVLQRFERIATALPAPEPVASHAALASVIDAAAGVTLVLLAGVANPLAATASVCMLLVSIALGFTGRSVSDDGCPESLGRPA